jgi:hypothetical protein
VEHAFEGASSSCGRTVLVVLLGWWTELKEGITIDRQEGLKLHEWSNED